MASCQMPEEFWEIAVQHLPPEKLVGPQGGRPPIPHRTVLEVLWYVLVTGCRWCDVPPALGCSGETARTRLAHWQGLGVWDRLHVDMLGLLRRDGELEGATAIVDSVQVRAHGGGSKSGPSPVDRRKPGRKYTFVVNAQGVPVGVKISGANVSDHREILPLIKEEYPAIPGRVGRPKRRPDRLYADAGYDSQSTRNALRCLGIEPIIRKSGSEHGSGLGKIRWVVERTIAWIKGLRRMRVSYDRQESTIDAWGQLAMTVVNFRIWYHDLRPGT
jgi:transposase